VYFSRAFAAGAGTDPAIENAAIQQVIRNLAGRAGASCSDRRKSRHRAGISDQIVSGPQNGPTGNHACGFRPARPENRRPIAENPVTARRVFGETVSGLPKGPTGNRNKRFPADQAGDPQSARRKSLYRTRIFGEAVSLDHRVITRKP
jgi:hypothetical protein